MVACVDVAWSVALALISVGIAIRVWIIARSR